MGNTRRTEVKCATFLVAFAVLNLHGFHTTVEGVFDVAGSVRSHGMPAPYAYATLDGNFLERANLGIQSIRWQPEAILLNMLFGVGIAGYMRSRRWCPTGMTSFVIVFVSLAINLRASVIQGAYGSLKLRGFPCLCSWTYGEDGAVSQAHWSTMALTCNLIVTYFMIESVLHFIHELRSSGRIIQERKD